MVNFVSLLLRAMNIADYAFKVEILLGIKELHMEYGIPNGNMVQQALLNILGDSKNPPSCVNPHQKTFIIEAFMLIQTLGIYGREFYTELMAQFLEADKEVRCVSLPLVNLRLLFLNLVQWNQSNITVSKYISVDVEANQALLNKHCILSDVWVL